jgi:hypothetical protein
MCAAWKESKPRIVTIGVLCGGAMFFLFGVTSVWHIVEFMSSLTFERIGAW